MPHKDLDFFSKVDAKTRIKLNLTYGEKIQTLKETESSVDSDVKDHL